MIKQELDKLNQQDIYSLILFTLFKIKDIPEYSAVSELAYTLDKNNLLNLCEHFGGTTITIPTLDEIENLIYSLLAYQYIEIEHKDSNDVFKYIKSLDESIDIQKIKKSFKSMCEVLRNYKFDLREAF